jgi:ribose transport system substrate-binding protein
LPRTSLHKDARGHYLIPVVSKTLDILELLQTEAQPMTAEGIHRRTRVSKTTVYRVLKTLVHRGYLAQAPDGTYRHVMRPRKLRFGFACQSASMAFSEDVTCSLRDAASAAGIELIVLDNRYDAATAVRNAEEFIRERVDLILEFNVEHDVAPLIGDKVAKAGIPLIAIDIPHPNGIYFGVDNYRAGMDAGEALAEYALETWKGKVDKVVGLDLPEAGLLVQSRVLGAFEAIRSRLPKLSSGAFVRLNGRGLRQESYKKTIAFLDKHPEDRRILVAAATDASALGAVDAARERRRTKHLAIVGQDCIAEAYDEMKRPNTPMIGSVSHETHLYGPQLMNLGLSIVKGQTVAPYNYATHRLKTRATIQQEG